MSIKMRRFIRNLNGREDGFTLIEVLCALAILGMIAIGLFSALGTSLKTTGIADERATAKNLAESQMEYVKQLEWANVYSPAEIPTEYSGYEAQIDTPSPVGGRDGDLQQITIKVFHHGKELMQLEGYKLR